nr:IS3 family transposase [Corynebacterium vitaeruminis]
MRTLCTTATQEAGACGAIYGYRVVHQILRSQGLRANEKLVREIMAEENLQPVQRRKGVYSSYEGENQHCPENLILVGDDGQLPPRWGQPSTHFTTHNATYPDAPLQHDFHADHPGQRLVTDISEFKAKDGKLYLSPLVDLFDGMVISATAGCHPTTELAVVMLEEGLATLEEKSCPIVHTDRGGQYRSQAWCNAAGDKDTPRFIPSMSRKATSGDNAVAEGFFGMLKRDLFPTARACENYTIAELIRKIDQYIDWYNNRRVKAGLGYKTIKQNREEYSRQTQAA